MTNRNEDFPPCSARQSLVQYHKDGTKDRVQRCTEPTADNMGLNVIPSDCEECPVRKAITKAAWDRGSYKPPLVKDVAKIQGFQADDNPDAPWLPCKDRQIVRIGSCCGKWKEIKMCNSLECFRLGSQVNPEHCRECPLRKG